MARIKGGMNAKKKHNRVLKLAKGYRGARSKQYRVCLLYTSEFDDNPMAVINPTHENQNISLPPKCVFAFVGGYIDVYAQEHHAQKVAEFVSATKEYPVYVLEDAGEEMVLCQAPVGAAPAVTLLD